MIFKVAKQDLEDALHVASGSVSGSGNDISAHFLFRVTDKDGNLGVEVLSYSGRLFSSCPVFKAAVTERGDGAFTIDGKRLRGWVALTTGTITFEFKDGNVRVKADKTKNVFQSLNPSTFPYWDKITAEAKPTGKIPAKQLAAALAYSKQFVSENEAGTPDLCVIEAKDGIFYSTNQRAATLVKVAGLEKSALRVHGKDAGALCAFLDTCKDGEVEILEHDRALFLRRADGAVFGESRFGATFPGLKVNMDEKDQRTWLVPKGDVVLHVQSLAFGAANEDNRLKFNFTQPQGPVTIGMKMLTGDDVTEEIPCIESPTEPNAPDIPADGFSLDRESLKKVLASWDADAVRFGVNVAGSRGFVRFIFEGDGNKYLTIAAWLRS